MQQETVMTPHRTDPVIQLKSGELLDIEDGEGVAVTCLDGALWVTQSHDSRDLPFQRLYLLALQ